MIVRQTTPEERRRTEELFSIAFEYPIEDEQPVDEAEEAKLHRWAAFDDETGEMMSHLSVTDFQMHFDGHSCLMGGMGGAATLPQYRRKGGIRGCFEAILPWMYENGYDFSYLYPFSTAYYRKYGYECGVQRLAVRLHLGLLRPEPVEGFFCLAESGHPMAEEICAVDEVLENRFNCMVCHDDSFYDWARRANPAKTQEFTYVCFGADGSPCAYTSFRKQDQSDGRNLVCSRFQFLNREGFAILMQLFKSLSTDHMYAKFHLPAKSHMEYLFPEWSLGAYEAAVENAGMIRVVNVQKALQKASFRGSGRVVLQIHDAQIPQNNQTLAVHFGNGRLLRAEPTDAPCALSLPVNVFSALIAGTCSFADALQWMPSVVLHDDSPEVLDVLDRMFYPKNLMICDYF